MRISPDGRWIAYSTELFEANRLRGVGFLVGVNQATGDVTQSARRIPLVGVGLGAPGGLLAPAGADDGTDPPHATTSTDAAARRVARTAFVGAEDRVDIRAPGELRPRSTPRVRCADGGMPPLVPGHAAGKCGAT